MSLAARRTYKRLERQEQQRERRRQAHNSEHIISAKPVTHLIGDQPHPSQNLIVPGNVSQLWYRWITQYWEIHSV